MLLAEKIVKDCLACAARLFTPCPMRSMTPLVRLAGSRTARGAEGTRGAARGDSWKGDRSSMGHGSDVSPSPVTRGCESDMARSLDEIDIAQCTPDVVTKVSDASS